MKKTSWLSKWLFTLAFLSVSSSVMQTKALASGTDLFVIENENNLSIDEIISVYCLEDIEIFIRLYETDFMAYYNAVIQNETFSYRDRKVALKDFRTFVSYFDVSYGIQKIQDYKIVVNDELCDQEQINGRHNLGTNRTVIKSNASDYVRSHENKHYYFEHFGKEGFTLSNGKRISTIPIHEAIASDLASLDFTADGFSDEYIPLTQILQAFYYMYGRDAVISSFAEEDFLENMVTSFHDLGFDDTFISYFFENLTGVMNSDKLLEFTYEEKMRDQYIYNVCECIARIYESKTGKVIQDSEEMKAILFGLLKSISFENISGNMIYKREFQKLKYDDTFFGIDLVDLSSLKVRVSDSEFFVKAYYNPSYEGVENDVIVYSFENGILEKIEGYNSFQYDTIAHVLSYGITDVSVIDMAVRSNLFFAYEAIVNRDDILTSDEKLYLIQHFKDFMNLHPSFFTINPSSDFLQILLARTFTRANASSEILQILENEEVLYKVGGADYIQELEDYGIYDFEKQKIYIQNMTIFEGFVDGLSANGNLGLKEEDIRKIILYFPNYVRNNPILQMMSENECYNYVYESIKSRTRITLAIDVYDTSKKEERRLALLR